MALFHHATTPASAGGMNLAPMLATVSPASGGGITLGADVLSCNLHLVPAGAFPVLALYVTQAGGGTGFIAATDAQLAEYPDAVTIAQLPSGDPMWADVLDFESGAATVAELVTWAKGALESYGKASRPGQRMPAVYCSASNVHVVANALTDGGVKSGTGLMLANWNLTEASAASEVITRSGPFPVIGIQYADPGPYDLDVWATAWLNTRSAAPVPAGYGAPKNLKAAGGDTTVRLTWQVPGTTGLPDPAEYVITVYSGTSATRSSTVPSYPRTETGTDVQVGSLARGKTYTAHVAASGPDGKDIRPGTWASAVFQTG